MEAFVAPTSLKTALDSVHVLPPPPGGKWKVLLSGVAPKEFGNRKEAVDAAMRLAQKRQVPFMIHAGSA